MNEGGSGRVDIKSEGKIGLKEYASIILIVIGLKLADTTPSLIYDDAKQAAWFVPFLGMLLFLPFFLLAFHVVQRYEGKNLIEVVNEVFGKYTGFLIGFLLFLFGFLTLVIDIRSYIDSIAVMYFPETPVFALLVLFMLGCLYNATRGLESIASVFYICLPYIKISLLLLFVLMFEHIDWNRMFPLLGAGEKQIVIQAVKKSSIFGDLYFFLLIFPYIHKKEQFKRISIIGVVLVAIEISFSILMYLLLFGFPLISRITYPFHEASKYIELGNFATRIETYFLFFWLLAAVLRFSFYLFSSSLVFGTLFKIKKVRPVAVPLTMLVITLALIPENPVINTFYMREINYTIISYGLMGFSVLFWGTDQLKRRIRS